jgi:Rad3-related DNA helicase
VALDSPFDLENSVLCIVPREAPDPRDGGFPGYVADAVRRLLIKTGKKALVLFTSHSMLRATRSALEEEPLCAEVMAQGVDGERGEITRRFKVADRAVLLGAASFWEGVDFPGEEAEVLVIAKLPFPVPTEPVVEARSEALYAEGVDPFMSYQLPEAVIRLRQGFGRLIRNQEDRGVVVILDRRVKTAPYSRAFLSSLPVEVALASDLESMAEEAGTWFQGVNNHAREDQGA